MTTPGSIAIENSPAFTNLKLTYQPLPDELPLFESLFRVADSTTNGSVVTHDEALEVLSLSCLPQEKLKMILNMTSKEDKLFLLNKQQFYTAIRLVQFTQNQQSVQNLTLTVPSDVSLHPPFFEGVTDSEAKNQFDSYTPSMESNECKINEDLDETNSRSEDLSLRCFMMEKEMKKMGKTLKIAQNQVQLLSQEVSTLKNLLQAESVGTDRNTHGELQKANSFPRIGYGHGNQFLDRRNSPQRFRQYAKKNPSFCSLSQTSEYGKDQRGELKKDFSFSRIDTMNNSQRKRFNSAPPGFDSSLNRPGRRQRSLTPSISLPALGAKDDSTRERYANSRLRSDLIKSFDYHQQQSESNTTENNNKMKKIFNLFWSRSEPSRSKQEKNGGLKENIIALSDNERRIQLLQKEPLRRSFSFSVWTRKRLSPTLIGKRLRENIPIFEEEKRDNTIVDRRRTYMRETGNNHSALRSDLSTSDLSKFQRYSHY